MADYSVTAANVIASLKASKATGIAGTTIAAGQTLYIAADGTLGLYGANGSAPANVFAGVALDGGAAGQPITYVKLDAAFQPGFAINAGDIVIGSANAGAMAPVTDLASGMYLTILGVGIGGNKMLLSPIAAGVAKA